MSNTYFQNYLNSHDIALKQTQITDFEGETLDQQYSVDLLCQMSLQIKSKKCKQHFVGNGASMAFTNHMALDWTKNGKVISCCYASASLLTAIVNDLGYDETFSAAVDWYGQPGDLLITISSSGNSKNIINAIKIARKKKIKVVTFSGLRPDNLSRKLGDLNFYVPAKTYGIVECAHQVLLHLWLDQFMGITEWDRSSFQNMRQDQLQL